VVFLENALRLRFHKIGVVRLVKACALTAKTQRAGRRKQRKRQPGMTDYAIYGRAFTGTCSCRQSAGSGVLMPTHYMRCCQMAWRFASRVQSLGDVFCAPSRKIRCIPRRFCGFSRASGRELLLRPRPSHPVRAAAAPGRIARLGVMCLQWHGYGSRLLEDRSARFACAVRIKAD